MDTYGNKLVNMIATKPLSASSSNLADMLTMVNSINFGDHSSKVKVMMVITDKCRVRGDATLCVVIFCNGTKNNNTSSHMLLDHCYAFGLLL